MNLAVFPSRETILQIGSFAIHWYGLLWAVSFWAVWVVGFRLLHYQNIRISRDDWTRLVAWGAFGALVGGRLGYVLLYEPVYFLQRPIEIFFFWYGGMASHGGFIGAALALWVFLQKEKKLLLPYLDVLTVPVAIALALGRLGNWLNLEIYGNSPVAILKNIFIAVACYALLHSSRFAKEPGVVAALFLIFYSGIRLLIEPLRDDPWVLYFGFTLGQIFTLPLLLAGVWLLVWLTGQKQHRRSKKRTSS